MSKPKKCRICRTEFVPARPMQTACTMECALTAAKTKRERETATEARKERAKHREAKAKVKRKSEYLDEAQTAFNAWVRQRDIGLPCISCGTTGDVQYCAGHYRPRGSNPALRFEPLNVHLQCNRNCNMAKSGNLGPYRIALIERIGIEKVDWLEGPHEAKRYSIEDLQAIKANYRALVRQMKKATESDGI